MICSHPGMSGSVEWRSLDHQMQTNFIDASAAILLCGHHPVCPFSVFCKQIYGSFRSKRSSDQANWIIYRYSEVLLLEAEAYIMMAKGMKPAGSDSLATVAEQNVLKDKAFKLIDAVNARSVVLDNDQVSNTNTLAKVTNYKVNETAVNAVEEILFQERRRELLFEGKRWYDLVRMARRAGNQKELITFIKKKHTAANSSKVDIQLKNPYAMYFPLYRDEVRNSKGVLKQNPAYKDDEKTEQAH